MYAIGNLAVQRQSLELAQQSLKDNRARVEIGTMAPLDIVQAEAEVATREEAVILAEAAIERQQDVLRALVSNPSSPDFWTTRIEPTETGDVRADDGRRRGRRPERARPAHRPRRARKNLEVNDINIRYFRNQSLPDVNAIGQLQRAAIGGTRLLRARPGLAAGRRSSGTVERASGVRLGTCSAAISRAGTCQLDWPIRSAARRRSAPRAGAPAAYAGREAARRARS